MEFKEFKEKYFGKSVDEIVMDLKLNQNFWKNEKDIIEVCINIDGIISNIVALDKNHPSVYLFQKRMIILRYIIENFTTLESVPEIDTFEDYDMAVEEAIYVLSSQARFVKQMVDEGLNEMHNIILEQLYQTFSTAIPNAEELEKLTQSLDDVFKNESPEKLKMIDSILAYNDPAMKELKEEIYNKNLTKIQQEIISQEMNEDKKE